MLSSLVIDSFMRIGMANIALGPGVFAFFGENEAGKSSIAESVRFALRGVSPRIDKKKDYDLLVTTGRKSGAVEVCFDGVPIRRNVRDGNLTTSSGLNFEEKHVDIQLGAMQMEDVDRKDLRKLFTRLLDVKADKNYVTQRLTDLGISGQILADTVDTIMVAGFQSAHEQAKENLSTAKGKWAGIAKEPYGHKKAETWAPRFPEGAEPVAADIANRKTVSRAKQQHIRSLSAQLGAAQATLKTMAKIKNQINAEDARTALTIAEDELRDATEAMSTGVDKLNAAVEAARQAYQTADRRLSAARQAAATLACPCCDAPLKVAVVEGIPRLERAGESASAAQRAVTQAVNELQESKTRLDTLVQQQTETVQALRAAVTLASDSVAREKATLDSALELAKLPKVEPGTVERLTQEIATATSEADAFATETTRLETVLVRFEQCRNDAARAAVAHREAQQWAAIEKACGQGQGSIPADLIASTTEPINKFASQVAEWWGGYQPFRVLDDLRIARADGMPYHLLSESAKWRANVTMQLAMAHVSKLKVVCIDRFDVLQANRRAAFWAMLAQFCAAHPDVTVMIFGTLTAAPPAYPGVRFFSVREGAVEQVQEVVEAA